jgi:hypothetical protein
MVRPPGLVEDRADVARLDHPAIAHHQDTVGDSLGFVCVHVFVC